MSLNLKEKRKRLRKTSQNTTKRSKLKIQTYLAQNCCEKDKSLLRLFNKNMFSLIDKKTIKNVNEFLDGGM